MREYAWDVKNGTRMGTYLVGVEMPFVEQSLRDDGAVRSILDVGGGSGRLGIPLAQQGYRVIVMEADPLPLYWLRQRSPNHPAVLTDARSESWPFRPGTVDCILAMEIPIVAFDWFWRECRRVLRPDGIVIACTTNRRSYKGAVYRIRPLLRAVLPHGWKGWGSSPDFYPLSTADFLAVMAAHGFVCERIRGLNWLPMRRSSDSIWIPWFATLEKWLGLRRFTRRSPWVMMKARARGPGVAAWGAASRSEASANRT